MGLFEITVSLIALLLILMAGYVVIAGWRTRGQLERALNMTLFLIKVPRGTVVKDNQQRSEKDEISIGEQMLSSFSNVHAKGWNRFIRGEPYLALEIAVHHVGEETHFYMAVPKTISDIIEKQIHSYYPTAEVGRCVDYNIFNPEGSYAGAVVKYKKPAILPIRTYQKLESDPLGAILTSLSKLQIEGEGASVQLLIRPSHADSQKKLANKVAREMQSGYVFSEAMKRVKYPQKPKKPDPNKPPEPEKTKVISPSEDDIIKAIAAKAGKQNFDVNVRILASAETELAADQILRELEGAFVQYNAPDVNSLDFHKLKGRALSKLAYNFAFRLFDDRSVMVMSTEEIVSLYHFPAAATAAPKVNFLKAKPAEPPPNLPKDGVHLGVNSYRGQETDVFIRDSDRRRHLYIIGQTGTGKTSIMKHMVEQDLAQGRGVCVVDPHGDFAEHVLRVVPPERAGEVIYFNPADLEMPLGLNMLDFDPRKPEQKTLRINELFAVIDKLYNLKETGGPMFEKYFRNAFMLCMDDFQHHFEKTGEIDESKIPVMADLSRVMVDTDFRSDKLSRETDPLVRQFWELEAQKAGGEHSLANMAPYISTKVDVFVTNVYLRAILNQRRNAFDFRKAVDEGKIIIVNLSKGLIGDLNSSLLGMLITGSLTIAALSRADTPEEKNKDFYMYIDEFQNYTSASISTILAEARKYRLNLIMAHQFIKQIPENIRDAVFGNVGSMAVFRVGVDDAEFLKNMFEPVFSPQDMINIDNYNAYLKMLIDGKTTRPFNIKTIKQKDGLPQLAEQIKQLSRLTYGRPREEVESEIRASYEDILG